MSASSWFEDPARKSLVKANAAERTFSNRNLAHADVAFDVASAGVAWPHLAAEVRTAFAAQTGEAIDAERWFVLRLVALWAARRDGELSRQEERRACSRVLQDYIAEVYLDDLPAATTGPLCGIDLDGVLETETLGFLGTSPAGGRALRALRAHDFRAVLVSGRSAGEVAERCRAYGLAGGVAEYGAATCSGGGADVRSELTGAQTAAVEAARAVLVPWPGVEIGSDHSFIVRAWTRDAAGRRCPLPREAVAAALACGPLRSIDGDDQTDLVPVGADKATGMRALADRLSTDGRLALAVGDTAEDLPMLGLASVAVAPRNASAAVRDAGVRIARRSYQAGTAEAVGHLIGHEPGGCPQCRAAESGRQRRRVLRILAARERGRAGLVAAAVTLVLEAHRP
jgi:3-deoxy-D-manno-octulosonate 8-phosphate phosphatase KdsC-like HAD superfamily phosphatase